MTLAASLTFLATIGVGIGPFALLLVPGGLPAAPLGAWVAHRIPARAMMLLVGVAICAPGIVGLVQTLVSPGRQSSWSGYKSPVAASPSIMNCMASAATSRPSTRVITLIPVTPR